MPSVRLDDAFKKRLEKKSAPQRAAILECVERLADDPTYPGLRTHPIQSQPGIFSARVDRANRVSFERDGDTLVMRNHCNHDAVYRRP
jgi:hypothetical protein